MAGRDIKMKKLLTVGTLAAAASMTCSTIVSAQDELDFLFGESTPQQTPAPARSDDAAGDDASAAQAADAQDDADATADDTPASQQTAAPEEPPLETIPLPRETVQPEPLQQAAPRGRTIEEIIVTAQRREESLQDVAISMTVFSQDQLSDANITNSADLAIYTPSLTANSRFGNENATFTIRGFTQDLRTTASVATYFAEVVAPRGQSSQSSGDGAGPGTLFDLQNVQVLKGPQGTLFGRNTTGGAILLVPQRPKDEFEGSIEASGGDFGARQIQAVVNIPVSDTFRLRLGIDDKRREGHLNNVVDIGADKLGDVNYTAVRGSLLWDITDNLENYTILQYVDSDSKGYTTRLFACNELIGSLIPEPNPFAIITVPQCQRQLDAQEASGQNGYYDLYSTVKTPITLIEEKRAINTLTWHVSENVTLKNILAYTHLMTKNGSNIFGTYFQDPTNPAREFSVGASVVNPEIPVTSQESYVAELQLQGSSFSDRMIWQTGVYYETSRPDGFSGNIAASFVYCDLGSLESGDPSQYNCNDPLAGLLGGVLVQEYKTTYLNQAVYAQATWEFNEYFNVTGGIRYTMDESEGFGIKTRYAYLLTIQRAPAVTITTPRTESEAPTGMLEFQYRPFPGTMSYVKYTRGYRQGSVNLAADPGVDTHDPEQVNTYEIGAKTQFGGPVPGRFNIAAFYNDFTDMQLQFGYISTAGGPTTSIANAGKARIRGFEADTFLQPFESLTAILSYSYLDTRLLEQDQEAQCDRVRGVGVFEGFTCTPIAAVGDQLPFAPRHSAVGSLIYTLPLSSSIGSISIGATYVYTGRMRVAASSESPFAVLDSFELLNLNLSWDDIFTLPLDLSVFATNVTDEQYMTYVGGTFNVLGIESRAMGQPRMIGARLKYRFGGTQ
jgi:iron complex outermembrane recepter protein